MDLSGWRKKMNELDKRIVELTNERARLVLEIGKFKKGKGTSLYDPEREEEIIELAKKDNSGPLEDDAIEYIFRAILKETREFGKKNL